ncbi:MAG: hypothetical protein QOK05_1375 [Chloroflexota bacterium]|nr:hypothetical protein [Chloroflexota bacterium]
MSSRSKPVVPGVFVLGMHRSGTSAVTQTLAQTGLTMCPPADLMPAGADNPAGFCECMAVVILNDAILRSVGGSWLSPPPLDEFRRGLQRWEPVARTILSWLHEPSPWLIKDPRLCLTLPFWRGIVTPDPAITLVLRHPVAVADSLIARDGLSMSEALTLWEQYLRAALVNCEGLRTVVVSYEELIEQPSTWAAQQHEFLDGLGVSSLPGAGALSAVDASLQHWKERGVARLTNGQRELWELAVSLLGIHTAFPSCRAVLNAPLGG